MLAQHLKKGDTIAIFSPSAPATVTANERYLRAKQFIESKGFNVLEGSLTGKTDGYRSGSIQDRAQEFNELLYHPDVKCIMSTIGGQNSNSLLPYIDYDYLKKNPKIIIGYSDVTALLLGIYAKTGLVTYYGPAMVSSFGEFEPLVGETYQYFEDILVDNLELPHQLPTPVAWSDEFINWADQNSAKNCLDNQLITVHPGVVTGRLIGGNLNTMQGIFGTDYMPEIKEGDILFIEDSLKTEAIIERTFSLLKLSGAFDKIGGLILGKHELFNNKLTGRKPYEILLEVMGDCTIPFLAEFDCSHTHPMLTLPIGSKIKLDATKQTVTIIEEEMN